MTSSSSVPSGQRESTTQCFFLFLSEECLSVQPKVKGLRNGDRVQTVIPVPRRASAAWSCVVSGGGVERSPYRTVVMPCSYLLWDVAL